MSDYVEHNSVFTRFEVGQSWAILSPIEQSIKKKIEAVGKPLKDWDIRINYGIKTGFNDAFIINGAKKDELIAQDPKSAEIIRPILRGKDIKRYGYDFHDKWLITTHNGLKEKNIPPVDVTKYPSIKAHLDQFYPQLAKRQDKGDTPYNLRNCAYMDDFSKQKIAWGNLCLHAQYAFVEEAYFVNNPANIIVPGDKYLLAMMNSNIADFYIRNLGVTRNGGYFEYKPMFVEKLPVPQADEACKAILVEIVNKIIDGEKTLTDTSELDSELNKIIYGIYNINEEEIRIIENRNKKS